MIPRTCSRFRGSSEEENSSLRDRVEELSCNEVIGGSGGGGMMFSEEARRAIAEERVPLVSLADVVGGGVGGGDRDSSSNHPRIDFQQHFQGFFVTISLSAVMFKSNELVKKQTALKGDQKISVLLGVSLSFMLYVICIYWWYQDDDILYPLAMFPPKSTPPFWHAIFIILVNDILARQAAMAFKCLLLVYYKNGRCHNFRRQAQMLTLVEYTLLLYRAFLPAPVWYRFFFNKDFGSLFSSLITGLYLTFKLTSSVEKIQCLICALKALSKKEVHYGVYATTEQVNAAGDLCAICQEKMHAPILLCCNHMFCEECVSE
ncbi:hypothetical protein TSUD_303030, partial [Trifolium subterraneum]